jgi:antitoxin PrlF
MNRVCGNPHVRNKIKVRNQKMPVSTLTSKGQTTIPNEIRRHLKLKPGDRIEFFVENDGKVRLIALNVDIASLEGLLAPAPRRASLQDMDRAIRKGATNRFRRSVRKSK